MTGDYERIFVEILYNTSDIDGNEIREKIQKIDNIPAQIKIEDNKPPSLFSTTDLEDRWTHLYLAAQEFQGKIEKRFNVELTIDPRKVYLSTISAYDDIERYKLYHLQKPYSDRSDAVKRAAYLTKWIARVSPFQTHFDEVEDDPRDVRAALVNHFFAIAVALSHLSVECNKKLVLHKQVEEDIIYDLLFRRFDEDALLARFNKLKIIALGSNVFKS